MFRILAVVALLVAFMAPTLALAKGPVVSDGQRGPIVSVGPKK